MVDKTGAAEVAPPGLLYCEYYKKKGSQHHIPKRQISKQHNTHILIKVRATCQQLVFLQ